MKKLLVCIVHHVSKDEEREKYLELVVENLQKYEMQVDIIVDTNVHVNEYSLKNEYKVFSHYNLKHPFHLTWMHRQHILDNINNYDYFAYLEDDILLPYENFKHYIDNFDLLWPGFVPGFVRVEKKDGEQYLTDINRKPTEKEIIEVENRFFVDFGFPQNYHGFWIMPQQALKETLKNDFVKATDGREFAAMYSWELNKKILVEVDFIDGRYQIKPECLSYHLPNNYAGASAGNGSIKLKDVFA